MALMRPGRSLRAWRAGLAAILLIIPLGVAWNLTTAALDLPRLRLKIGRLYGVTSQDSVEWTFAAFKEGKLQKTIALKLAETIPIRPVLIRFSNDVRYRLFGAFSNPDLVRGDNNQLIERPYLTEYCARDLVALERRAAAWIPKLKELQSFYEMRGHHFLYLITPSKAAHLPEVFVHRVPCASRERDRKEWLTRYDRLLAEAGVPYLDLASLTHGLKDHYRVSLFPVGGVHWNMLGVAHAADALAAKINELAGRNVASKFTWSYENSDTPTGLDRDLADLVNVNFFQTMRYPAPIVTFRSESPCATAKTSDPRIGMVGGSFNPPLARVLARFGCLGGLRFYNYLFLDVFGGPDYQRITFRPSREELLELRDMDFVMLEENESSIAASGHAAAFHRLVTGAPETSSAPDSAKRQQR